MNKTKILILAANPWDTKPLALDEEYQRIQDLHRKSAQREQFDICYCPALRGEAIQQEVLDFKPHIIQFSGHGETNGLAFADLSGDKTHWVSKDTLAHLFKLCAPDLKAVFLNACYSAEQSEAIVEQVGYVIGMKAAIDDLAAISFSKGFYTAVFANESIDNAFSAGINQMEIDQISSKERQKPVLQKCLRTFVPNHQYDVAISFADKNKDWTAALSDYLQSLLKQKLETADGFQIYAGDDFAEMEKAAMLLIIASPDYIEQHETQLKQLGSLTKQKPAFLVETDSYKLPNELKGLSRQKFWRDDEEEGLISLQGDAYISQANQLADLVAKKLQELQNQYQHQQRIQQQRESQQLSRKQWDGGQDLDTQLIDAFIFLHSAPEDLEFTEDITPLLEQKGIDYVLPLERTDDVLANQIREDIENNIINCDAVLILYEHTTLVWVREQLGVCRRLQRKREMPLKVIAVYKDKNNPDINMKLDNLQIYSCPPEKIKTYLSHFVEALK